MPCRLVEYADLNVDRLDDVTVAHSGGRWVSPIIAGKVRTRGKGE